MEPLGSILEPPGWILERPGSIWEPPGPDFGPFRLDFVQSPEKALNFKIYKNARDFPCFYYKFRRFDFVSVSFCAIARTSAKPKKF